MKENKQFFIGIDVSKQWFDASFMLVENHQKLPIETSKFDNNAKGIKTFDKWLKERKVTCDSNTLVVIENTGVYHRLLWSFCSRKNLPLHIGNAAHLKWSFGIARGKNDKIDSIRICQYAWKEADCIKATPILDSKIMLLKDLMTLRRNLLRQLNSILNAQRELKFVSDKAVKHTVDKSLKEAILGIRKSIKKVDEEIKKIVAESDAIKSNYNLLISVPGIGNITAIYLICCTGNFSNKVTGKQLASYAGLAPFEHTSGSSVRGKKKVSKMANKELKSILNMGALSTIKCYSEFKNFYQRKIAEGKCHRQVMNAIKNKIVLRAAAVINNQRSYVENYQVAA